MFITGTLHTSADTTNTHSAHSLSTSLTKATIAPTLHRLNILDSSPTCFFPHILTISLTSHTNKQTHSPFSAPFSISQAYPKPLPWPLLFSSPSSLYLSRSQIFLVHFFTPIPPNMLPYTSIQEAEAALGRSLTTAETLWFNYSSTKSDYYLYCHNILFLFLIFSIVPLYYLFLEFFLGSSIQAYKIQPKVKLSLSDCFNCYKSVMRMFILVVGPLQLVSYPSVKMIGIRTSLPLPSIWEIVAQLTVYFVVEDYGNYWIHRFLHCKWGYEKIHKVHHEYTAPIGFAAPYAHWAEVLILGIPSFIGPAIVPGHMITFWLWIGLRQIEAIETHSGLDLPWTPTKYIPFYGGSDYHDYHHYVGGLSQSNFASVFTYCDYIYGTDKGYRYQKKVLQQLREGLKSDADQNGVPLNISSENLKVD